MKKTLLSFAAITVIAVVYSHPAVAADGQWEFDIGAEKAFGYKTTINPGQVSSYYQNNMPTFFRAHGWEGPDPGPVDQIANRQYNNSYVGVGDGSGNTSDWGYQNPFPGYNHGGGSFCLRADQSMVTVNRSLSGGSSIGGNEEDQNGWSLAVSLGRTWAVTERLRLGAGVGFNWLPLDEGNYYGGFSGKDCAREDFRCICDRYQTVDGSCIPDAPYHGNAGGQLINNIPIERHTDSDFAQHYSEYNDSYKLTYDGNLFTWYLGPRGSYWIPLTKSQKTRLVLGAEGGASFNWLNACFEQSETFSYAIDGGATQTKSYHRSYSEDDFGVGAYAKVKVGISGPLGKKGKMWNIALYGKYDWRPTMDAGALRGEFSGCSLGGQAGLSF